MIPDLSSLATKKGATVGIPTGFLFLAIAVMSNGGEYWITNPIDDVKDNDKDLQDLKHQVEVVKRKLVKLSNAVCNHPDFTCMDR